MLVKLAIFSYSRMKEEMQEVWNEFKLTMNIQIIEGALGEALTYASRLEKEGDVDVYISGGANAEILRQNVNTPVVTIRVTGFDLLLSIQNAQKYGGKIAVINFGRNIPLVEEIQEILKV